MGLSVKKKEMLRNAEAKMIILIRGKFKRKLGSAGTFFLLFTFSKRHIPST